MNKILTILLLSLLASGVMQAKKKFTLKRGINIAHWLSQSETRGELRERFFTEKDVKYIASLGFDHIRIPIDEEQMFDIQGNKETEAFALLERAIDQCLKERLKVVVDLHILRSHFFNAAEKPLFTQATAQEAFYECWRKLSATLRKYPTNMVAYELMNEPVADNPEDWNRIALQCYKVIRTLEPKRVIVLGSNRWQSFDQVKYLRIPENDQRIIISFHYYNPFLLTHYQASWTSQRDYNGPVHYPGLVVEKEEFEGTCPEGLKNSLNWNTKAVYDIEKIRQDFQEAVNVAARHGLQIYCGEYGCLNSAPMQDRLRWHGDMEKVFDEMGISRALWCYREGTIGFGILKEQSPDNIMLKALCLPDKAKR